VDIHTGGRHRHIAVLRRRAVELYFMPVVNYPVVNAIEVLSEN
jgi:hypothetical protein